MTDTPVSRVASSSSLKDLGTDSDPDNRERPVREKLQKTSIDTLPSDAITTSDQTMLDVTDPDKNETSSGDNSGRGRVRRKRSYEDMAAGPDNQTNKPERHTRKKSRDMSSTRIPADARHTPSEAIAEESTERKINTAIKSTEFNGAIQEPDVKTVNGEEALVTTPPGDTDSKNAIVSPKNKRNRDEFLQDTSAGISAPAEKESSADPAEKDKEEEPKSKSGEEPKPKRQRDSGSPQPPTAEADGKSDNKSSAGGFANTAVTSPFSSLTGSKSPQPQPQTSASAFASSGFGSLASSATSPFGSLGGSQPAKSPFAAATSEKKPLSTFASSAAAPSAFGAALGGAGSSPFSTATTTSGFGGLGGKSFGSAFGGASSGGRLTSFAGGSGPSITGLGGKPAKPFGAQAEEDEDEEGSGDDEEEPDVQSPQEDKKDPRFHEQEIATGEEAEDEVFKCRAKLYNYAKVSETSDKKEWKERGVGDLKLLVSRGDSDNSKKPVKARFVMRADKSHRLLLNSPILKNGKYGTSEGALPKNGYLLFMGTIDEKPVELLQIKMKAANAEEMWKRISDLQKEM